MSEKFGYRNVYYDSRKKTVKLWYWDDKGNRIEREEPFRPYIFIESNTSKDAISIFNTPLRKIDFPSQFERRKYVNECGIKRLFYNLRCEQQFLIDTFGCLQNNSEYGKFPLKIFYIDIEIYSPYTFPVASLAAQPINLITVFDTISQKYYTFGLNKDYTPDLSNVVYVKCSTERELLEKFLKFWELDHPDIVSGWNCIEENELINTTQGLIPIKDLKENTLLNTNNIVKQKKETGIKQEWQLKTSIGSIIKCSIDHRFKVYYKGKNNYKNTNTLLEQSEILTLKDILEKQQKYDIYVEQLLGYPKTEKYNYKDILSDDLIQLLGFIFTDGTRNIKDNTIGWCNKYKNVVESYTEIYNKIFNKKLKLSTPQMKDKCYYKRVVKNLLDKYLPIIYNTTKCLDINILSQLNFDQLTSFFAGLIDGDGFIDEYAVNICNYENQINKLHQLLLINGIFSIQFENYIRIPNTERNKHFLNIISQKMFQRKRQEKIQKLPVFEKHNTVSKKIKHFEYKDKLITKIDNIKSTTNYVNMYDIETTTHYFTCSGITTHNCEQFDIPYIINRIKNILGEEECKRLSPVNSLFYKEDIKTQFGKTQGRWCIHGVQCIDYMEAYKTFSRKIQESYSLNYISQVELNEGKLNVNATSLAKLSEQNWKEFVDYNIQDVALIIKLENKLRFLQIMRMISYKGFSSFESSMGKIAVITGAIAQQAKVCGKILSTFTNEDMGSYSGGFVKDIEPGLREDIVTFDANSLYPNTLISLNLSPETKIGKIIGKDNEKNTVEIRLVNGKIHNITLERFKLFLDKNKISISKAKVLYTQKEKGIIPIYVDSLYEERVKTKKEISVLEQENITLHKNSAKYKENKFKIGQLDIVQHSIKILLNAIYGVFANKYSPFYDIDHAASITNTGQAVIKAANTILEDYVKKTYNTTEDSYIYSDTDSAHFTLKPLLDKCNIKLLNEDKTINSGVYDKVNELQNVINLGIAKWAKESLNSTDPRFVFKREAICPVAIYQAKKHYILYIKDKGETKPVPCDYIKYVGVEVATSKMSEPVKKLIKKVVESIVYEKDRIKTNEVYRQAYEDFKKLPITDIAFRTSINDYDKYARSNTGFVAVKRTPCHVKAAINYNLLLKEFNVENVYDNIASGQKIKWIYIQPNNKYNISAIAFINKYPTEFENTITPDFETMFEKLIKPAIERFYVCVKWRMLDMRNQITCDLLDLFGE